MRNSIQISQVQKFQNGKQGSLPSCLAHVEPLEKATLNALLFADRVPAKTAVCLHQTGQKRRPGPASQAACHEAGRPGHETQDGLQAIGLTDGLLARLCAKSHAPAGGHTLLSERDGEADRIRSPPGLEVSFWMEAAGPRRRADSRRHLHPRTGVGRPTSCGAVIPRAPPVSRSSRPSSVYLAPAASVSAAHTPPAPGGGCHQVLRVTERETEA